MKTFTRADILSWQPCHGKTKTLRIMRGLPRMMNAIDVLRHDGATPADRLWCVLRPEVISGRTLRLFAAWCARTALDSERAANREPDPRSWAAVETAERYALGKATEDEMCSAHDAAYAAAYAAAADAADAAAYAAADAAYAAAYATTLDDDCAAVSAYAAALSAADAAAARAAQIARLIQMIEENEK